MSSKTDFSEQFKSYYDNGYNGWMMNVKSSHKFRFKWAIRKMKEYKADIDDSLEIACASGDFTEYLLKLYPNINKLYCIDICKEAVDICKKRIGNDNVVFDIKGLPDLDYESNCFDVIWCMDVIYYLGIGDRDKSVSEINRILDDDGIALFMIPYNVIDCSSIRRIIKKHMEIVNEAYNYNKLWGDCTLMLEKKYKKYKERKGFYFILSEIYFNLMKSSFLMKAIHCVNVVLFKNRISHYMVIAKKRYS